MIRAMSLPKSPSATLQSARARSEMSSIPNVMPRGDRDASCSARIDRLGWAAGTCIDTYGVKVGVRSNDTRLLDLLEPHLPPGWTPASSPYVDRLFSLWVAPRGEGMARRPSRLYDGGFRRARTRDLDELLAILESEIRLSVAAEAREWIFVHAGVVGWRGRAILVPGRSRSGKTTLVAELVKAGAAYYSDEFAVLDAQGRVHPFPKPLSVRGEGGCDRHARRQSAEELGGVCGREPLPVGLVVLAEHRAGASWRPRRLSAGQAVLEILSHTVPARLRPEDSLATLGRAVQGAEVLQGERGEARDLAVRLLAWMEEPGQFFRRTGERGK
jgi:hypothetical protein